MSFIDLWARFPDNFPGKGRIVGHNSQGSRSIFWVGISRQFTAVLNKLKREGLIRINNCNKEIYMHDLALFEDERPAVLNDPEWIPIVYDATDKGKKMIRSLDLGLLKQLMAREIDYQLNLHSRHDGQRER